MPIEHIITALSVRLAHVAANPQQVIYAVTTLDMLQQIVGRMGAKALQLSAKDLIQARREVRTAIEHFSDYRDCINIGLDACDLGRTPSNLIVQHHTPELHQYAVAA